MKRFVLFSAFACLGAGVAHADVDPARERLLAALDGLAEASGDGAAAVEVEAPAAAPVAAAPAPEVTAEPEVVAPKATAAKASVAAATPAAPAKTPLGALGEREVEASGQSGWLAVGVALVLLTAVAAWLKRASKRTTAAKGLAIETLASARVSGKHAVSVVKVGGRVLVVGQSDQGLTLLTELADDEVPSMTKSPARTETKESRAVDTGAGSFVERVSRMRAGWKDQKGDARTPAFPTDPFHAALMKDAPVDELAKMDERAQIRERLEALRRRSLSVA